MRSKTRIYKSALSLLLLVCVVMSSIPFSASAGNGATLQPSTTTSSPVVNPAGPTGMYPAMGEPGYVQMTKSAQWSNTTKTKADLTLEVFGAPVPVGVDTMLILDTSASMIQEMDRIEIMKKAANEFIDIMFKDGLNGQKSDHRVGLVDFNGQVMQDNSTVPVGVDKERDLKANIENMKGGGDTNYTEAFEAAGILLSDDYQENRPVVIIFLTDGVPYVQGSQIDEISGVEECDTVKAVFGAEVFVLGVNIPDQANIDKYLKPLATDDDHIFDIRDKPTAGTNQISTTDMANVFAKLAGLTKLAGTDAVINDVINTADFEATGDYKIQRKVGDDYVDVLDGSSGLVTIDKVNNTVKWNLGNIYEYATRIVIDLEITREANDVYKTNLDQLLAKPDGSYKGATIEYLVKNDLGQDVNLMQEASTPFLSRPDTTITTIYYEVDKNGDPLDNAGNLMNTNDFDTFKQNLMPIHTKGEQRSAAENYTVIADHVVKNAANVNYDFVIDSRFASSATDRVALNPVGDQPLTVYFGVTKSDSQPGEDIDINFIKRFNPVVNGLAAEFTITDADNNAEAFKLEDGNVKNITLKGGMNYCFEEKPLRGFVPQEPFYLKAISGVLNLTDANGIPVNRPGNVEVQGQTVTVMNKMDDQDTKDFSYVVKIVDEDENVIDTLPAITKAVWYHATEIEVDKIDLAPPFANGYKLVNYEYDGNFTTQPPASVKDKALIIVHMLNEKLNDTQGWIKKIFSPDFQDKQEAKFKVTNVDNHFESETFTLTDNTEKLLEFKSGQTYEVVEEAVLGYIKIPTFYIANNNKVLSITDSGGNPLQSAGSVSIIDNTVTVRNEKDNNQKHDIKYNVIYSIDGKIDDKEIGHELKDVWILETTLPVQPVNLAKYPDHVLKEYKVDLISHGKNLPATIENNQMLIVELTKETPREVGYTVKYFIDNTHQTDKDETEKAMITGPVDELDIVKPPKSIPVGYKVQKYKIGTKEYANEADLPAKIADKGILEVYLVIDDDQTNKMTYTVVYYKDGVNEDDRYDVTKDVHVTKNTITVVESATEVNKGKYTADGYLFDKMTIDGANVTALPKEVSDKTVVHVYFKVDASRQQDVAYDVEIYLPDVVAVHKTYKVTKKIPLAASKDAFAPDAVDLKGYEFYTVDGYILDSEMLIPTMPATVKDGSVLRVYLKQSDEKQEFKYQIEYLVDIGDGYYETHKTEDYTETVWVGLTELQIKKDFILDEIADKMPDTIFDKIEPAFVNDQVPVALNGVLKVYVNPTQDSKVTKKYTVSYLKQGTLVDPVNDVIPFELNVWKHTTKLAVKANTIDEKLTKYPGYVLQRYDPYMGTDQKRKPMSIPVDGNIKVYMIQDPNAKEQITYTVEYYKTDAAGETLAATEDKTVTIFSYQTEFTALKEDKNLYLAEGYSFDKSAPINADTGAKLQVKRAPDKEILKVYYSKNTNATKPVKYSLNYYIDGKLDYTVPQSATVWVGEKEYLVPVKDPTTTMPRYTGKGLSFENFSPSGAGDKDAPTVKLDGNPFVVDIHMKKDTGAVRDITYTFEFYADGVSKDYTHSVKTSVHPMDGDTVTVAPVPADVLAAKKLAGYKFSGYIPANVVGTKVTNGTTIRVNLVKDLTKTKQITVNVDHLVDGDSRLKNEITKTVWSGETKATLTQAEAQILINKAIAPNGELYGYKFASASPTFGTNKELDNDEIDFKLTYVGDDNVTEDVKITARYVLTDISSGDVMDEIDEYITVKVPFLKYEGPTTAVELKEEDFDTDPDKFERYTIKTNGFNTNNAELTSLKHGDVVEISYESTISASTPTMFPYKVKVVTKGGKITNGRFKFKITDVATGKVVPTPFDGTPGDYNKAVGCTAQGNVEFKIYYAKPGIYTYKIEQVSVPKGVTPDKRTFTVKVEVQKGANGKLVVLPHYQSVASLTFENIG